MWQAKPDIHISIGERKTNQERKMFVVEARRGDLKSKMSKPAKRSGEIDIDQRPGNYIDRYVCL